MGLNIWYKRLNEMLFSTPPSLRIPPYVLQDKTPRNATGHGRREGKIPTKHRSE